MTGISILIKEAQGVASPCHYVRMQQEDAITEEWALIRHRICGALILDFPTSRISKLPISVVHKLPYLKNSVIVVQTD